MGDSLVFLHAWENVPKEAKKKKNQTLKKSISRQINEHD